MRGISIFVNLICHTAGSVVSEELISDVFTLKGLEKFIMIIFMVGYVVFSGFRTIFIYISGYAFGLTYA